MIIFPVNIYFTKIAWSFCVRLDRSHELLIIHGKYLEKMMNDEQTKFNELKTYLPPDIKENKVQELTSVSTQQGAEEQLFDEKRKPNLFSNLAKS